MAYTQYPILKTPAELKDEFLAKQRELYKEYRKTHKLSEDTLAKYVENVQAVAEAYLEGRRVFRVYGKVSPKLANSRVVLGKYGDRVDRVVFGIIA